MSVLISQAIYFSLPLVKLALDTYFSPSMQKLTTQLNNASSTAFAMEIFKFTAAYSMPKIIKECGYAGSSFIEYALLNKYSKEVTAFLAENIKDKVVSKCNAIKGLRLDDEHKCDYISALENAKKAQAENDAKKCQIFYEFLNLLCSAYNIYYVFGKYSTVAKVLGLTFGIKLTAAIIACSMVSIAIAHCIAILRKKYCGDRLNTSAKEAKIIDEAIKGTLDKNADHNYKVDLKGRAFNLLNNIATIAQYLGINYFVWTSVRSMVLSDKMVVNMATHDFVTALTLSCWNLYQSVVTISDLLLKIYSSKDITIKQQKDKIDEAINKKMETVKDNVALESSVGPTKITNISINTEKKADIILQEKQIAWIVGKNGSSKTSILESAFYKVTGNPKLTCTVARAPMNLYIGAKDIADGYENDAERRCKLIRDKLSHCLSKTNVFIDEIEMHLDDDNLKSIMDFIITTAKEKDLAVLITTKKEKNIKGEYASVCRLN